MRSTKHGEGALVTFYENAELVAHLIQFVPAQHVQVIALAHEDPQLRAITEYAIVVLVLDLIDFFFIDLHENSIFDYIAGEVHVCLLLVAYRSIHKAAVRFLGHFDFSLFALFLQPQLILELDALILLFEGCLHVEAVDFGIV